MDGRKWSDWRLRDTADLRGEHRRQIADLSRVRDIGSGVPRVFDRVVNSCETETATVTRAGAGLKSGETDEIAVRVCWEVAGTFASQRVGVVNLSILGDLGDPKVPRMV
jgi:hypothetical protein